MDDYISQHTRELIISSRDIAIKLGADGISSLHIFLADCTINDIFSIKNFAFNSESEFNKFYNAQLIDTPNRNWDSNRDSIPLTIPAEKAIMRAKIEKKNTLDVKMEPHHIFLAMSKLKNSQFVSLFPKDINLHTELLEYYSRIGCLSYSKSNNKFSDQLKAYIKSKIY